MNTYLIRIKCKRAGQRAIPIQARSEEEAIEIFCEKFAIRDMQLVAFVDDVSYEKGLLSELTYCQGGPLIVTDKLALEMKIVNGMRFDDDLLQVARENALEFWKRQPHLAEEFINVMGEKRRESGIKPISPLFSKELYASVLLRFIVNERWYESFSIERVKDKKVAEKLIAKVLERKGS